MENQKEKDNERKSHSCEECKDIGFRLEGERRVTCACIFKKKIKRFLTKLLPIKEPPVSYLQFLDKFTPKSNYYILSDISDIAVVNGILAKMLLKFGLDTSYTILNIYELVDIFLGHNPEYQSIFDIYHKVVILTAGYNEMENKRLEEITIQFMTQKLRKGDFIWLYNNGLSCNYNLILDFMKSNGYQELNYAKSDSRRKLK